MALLLIGTILAIGTGYDLLIRAFSLYNQVVLSENIPISNNNSEENLKFQKNDDTHNEEEEPLIINHLENLGIIQNIPWAQQFHNNMENLLIGRVLLCFSVVKNLEKLLETSESSGNKVKSSNGEPSSNNSIQLSCIHGVRVLSICWVIYGHIWSFALGLGGTYLILYLHLEDLNHGENISYYL